MAKVILLFFALASCYEVFSAPKDSLDYYSEKRDYSSLRRLVLKELDSRDLEDARLLYYYSLSYSLDNTRDALAKTDSILVLPLFQTSSIWKQRLQQLRISYLRKNGRYKKSIVEGKILMKEIADSVVVFDIAYNIGISFRKLNQYDSALKWSIYVEAFAQLLNDDLRLHRALQNRANLYDNLGQLDKARALERSLLKIADRLENPDLQILDRSNLGSSYVTLKKYDSARFYLEEALSLSHENHHTKRVPLILYNLGNLEAEEGDFSQAISTLKKCVQFAIKASEPAILVRAQYMIAWCYFENGDLETAEKRIDLSLDAANRYKLIQDKLYLLDLLADVQYRKSEFKETVKTIKTARALEDSIMNDGRIKLIEELEAKYETEKKEQQIAGLRKASEISSLRNQRQLLLFSVVGLLLIGLLIVGFFVLRNRNLKSTQDKLITEQRLLRTQMNPHFLFNALASINAFIFKGDKYEASEYLSTFSQLTRNILTQSVKEWITLKEELSTISQYLEIQKLRFGKLSFHIDASDELHELLVPPVLLQPFVENSIVHGFKGSSGGEISIQIKEVDNELLIEINDTGVGLSDEEKSSSQALKITRSRLALLYPKVLKGDCLQIFNRISDTGMIQGVTVRLALPIKEAL